MIKYNWTDFKLLTSNNNLSIRMDEREACYYLTAHDGPTIYRCDLLKVTPASTEQLDFETNYKSNTNQRFEQVDTDGAEIVRIKAAKKGWSFWAVPIEITTSLLGGSLYCKDSTLTDIPGITCKIYNDSDVEITVPGLANINLATCAKTVIDFEPAFDYEVVGGALRVNSNPVTDIRLWIVGAPDIPAIYGGSKEFASGINLKFLAPDSSFEIDGRVTKFLKYNSTTHEGKLRIILRHPLGSQVNLQFVLHLYRQ